MRKQFLSFLCLIFILSIQVVLAQEGYLIKGEITGVDNTHTYAYLSLSDHEKNLPADSVKVVNGKFTFKGKVTEPNIFKLSIKNVPSLILLVLETKQITIKGSLPDLWKSHISGSPLTDEYIAYQVKYLNPAREEMINNTKLAMELQSKGDSVKAAEYYTLNGYIMQKQHVHAEQYIKDHPGSFFSLPLLAWGWEEFGTEKTINYLRTLSTELQDHSIAQKLAQHVAKTIQMDSLTNIGMPALDFSLADTSGNFIRLNSFRSKYVLVDFWASWCGPCRVENPNLVKAYEKYKAYGFEILSVSVDEDKQKWYKAIIKDNLTWTHVSDLKGWQNQVAILYGITAIPSNFLLDPEGKIIAKNLRGKALEKQLQEVFAKP